MIPDEELELSAIRAQGAGGQNVNKVSSAAHLRFDVAASRALPDECKRRVLALRDRRITTDGVVVIKAQQHRTFERNKAVALERLRTLLERGLSVPKPRKPTKPSAAAVRKRLEDKARQGELKRRRRRIDDE